MRIPPSGFASWLSYLAIEALAVLVSGCVTPVHAQIADPADSVVIVQRSESCPRCSVHLDAEVTLGPGSENHGGVSFVPNGLKRDSRGRYYIPTAFNPGTILVFDSTGMFRQTLGRFGTGPGEYTQVSYVLIDRADSIHVFDNPLRRHTVLTPDYDLARTTTLATVVRSAVEVPGSRLVIAAQIPTRTRFGYPLHLLEGPMITRSFEDMDAGSTPSSASLRRVLAPALAFDGHFWSAHAIPHRIDLWNVSGKLIKTYARRPADIPESLHREERSTIGGRLNPSQFDLQVDGDGMIWSLFMVRAPQWRERARWGIEVSPGVFDLESTTGNVDDLLGYLIEVIDPESGQILVSMNSWDRLKPRADRVMGFVGQGRLAVYQESEVGEPSIAVYRFALRRSPQMPSQ